MLTPSCHPRNHVIFKTQSIFVMTMSLRDLQYFAVVAEHRHLGRAAEALDMSQPALSMSLRRLEAFLHAKLVKRTPKGVDLTPAGEVVYAHSRRLRLSVDDMAREVADLSQGQTGLLRIGTAARFAVDLLPTACVALVREAPRVTLKIELGETTRGAPALSRGELDLYLTGNALSGYDDLVQEHLFEEEWVVIGSARHRLARKKQVTLTDLSQERWILSLFGPAQEDLLRAFAQTGLPPPTIAAEVNFMPFRRQLLLATDWLTFGPRQFFREGAPSTGLTELPLKGLSSRRSVSVCYRKDAYLSPLVRRFIEILKSTAQKMTP